MRLDWQLMRVALTGDGRCPHSPQLQIGVRAAQILDLVLAGALADTADGAQLRPGGRAEDLPDSPLARILQTTHAVIPWDQLLVNQLGDVPHGTRICAQAMVEAGVWRVSDGHRALLPTHRYTDADDTGRSRLRTSVDTLVDDPARAHDARLLLLAYLADGSQLFGAPSRNDAFDCMQRYAGQLHVADTGIAQALDRALWATANDWHRAVSGFGINLGGV